MWCIRVDGLGRHGSGQVDGQTRGTDEDLLDIMMFLKMMRKETFSETLPVGAKL